PRRGDGGRRHGQEHRGRGIDLRSAHSDRAAAGPRGLIATILRDRVTPCFDRPLPARFRPDPRPEAGMFGASKARDRVFFQTFTEHAQRSVEAATLLLEMFEHPERKEKLALAVSEKE